MNCIYDVFSVIRGLSPAAALFIMLEEVEV